MDVATASTRAGCQGSEPLSLSHFFCIMITISIDAPDGCWDNYSFSIEEAMEKISELDAALDDASGYRALLIKDAMVQLEEAIAEATISPEEG